MATSSHLFLLAAAFTAIIGITSAATAASPAPIGPSNLTGILDKGGQYNSFIRLLRSTQIDKQLQSQLDNSFNGLTIFAPTDNAFNNLKPGTLNGLSSQDQVNLVLSHVLPRYYSLSTFQTASNPVSTQASGPDGVYTVNVTSTTNQVNVTTGVVESQVNNALFSDFPLAVYSVDKVLLPSELFGAKPPTAALAPEPEPAE
ncbi:fasciclin-like arabinogalactan protein 9, partial [Phalaenopsis equestris]|uniref:fasciclin-like arabinogalactan protein 9 n=1 Tax=Phalaenopsis equestris TaxID=78828 RepID=UPI0009E5AA9D